MIDNATKEKVLELYNKRYDIKSIAQICHVSVGYVQYTVKVIKQPRKKRGYLSQDVFNYIYQIIELKNKGFKRREILEKLDIDEAQYGYALTVIKKEELSLEKLRARYPAKMSGLHTLRCV